MFFFKYFAKNCFFLILLSKDKFSSSSASKTFLFSYGWWKKLHREPNSIVCFKFFPNLLFFSILWQQHAVLCKKMDSFCNYRGSYIHDVTQFWIIFDNSYYNVPLLTKLLQSCMTNIASESLQRFWDINKYRLSSLFEVLVSLPWNQFVPVLIDTKFLFGIVECRKRRFAFFHVLIIWNTIQLEPIRHKQTLAWLEIKRT